VGRDNGCGSSRVSDWAIDIGGGKIKTFSRFQNIFGVSEINVG
jgi:hypothetical protein